MTLKDGEKMTMDITELVRQLEFNIERMPIRCLCVNWLGGCRREPHCTLGYLRNCKDLIAQLKAYINKTNDNG